MEPFRDELDAAHERIEHLEQELAEARGEKKPPPQPEAPPPAPTATRGSRLRAARWLAILAAIGVGGYYAYPHVSSGEWEGVHGAILTDLNGDGVPDIVGRIRHLSPDRITLAATDGKTGRRLWESERLGVYIETYQGALGLAGDTLLYAAPGGDLHAFGARDGRDRWSGRLPEQVKSFCAGGQPDEVRIRLANDAIVSLALADGRSLASTAEPHGGACQALPDDSSGTGSRAGRGTDGTLSVEAVTPEISKLVEDMRVGYAMRRPGGPLVLFGSRKVGTSVPMIAAVYDDVSRNWSHDMPATDVLKTSAEAFVGGTISSTRVFATYERGSSDPHVLVCFDLTGKRQWETPLPTTDPLTLVQATEDRVLVSQWGRLTVYDAKSGAVLFAIGG